MYNNNKGSFPPWSRLPSLKEMTEEAGIDFEQFIENIEGGCSTRDMARKFGIDEQTIKFLKEHFFKYGVNSIMGGD